VAKSQKDRVRASKLRKKKNITAKEHAWLSAYESGKASAAVAPAPAPARPFTESKAFVHETKRLEDVLDPQATLFKPVVLEGGASSPPAPGMPAPPAPGTPLVDALPAASAQVANGVVVDPDAASKARAKEQLRMMVLGLCFVGVRSANELLVDRDDVPDMFRAWLADPAKGFEMVGNSCDALADKYKLKAVPGGDEVVVGGACLASALAAWAAQKKRKQKPRTVAAHAETSPTTNAATSPAAQGVDVPVQSPPRPNPAAWPPQATAATLFTGDDK
jgi:hypothetical protein